MLPVQCRMARAALGFGPPLDLGLALPAFEVLFAFGAVTEAPWPFTPSARPRRVPVEASSAAAEAVSPTSP
jgi:hypothetical protein